MVLKRFTLFLLMMMSLGAFASVSSMRQADITGKVLDEQAQPVIGAVVKNLKTGAVAQTDVEGTFRLAAAVGDQLEISFVGYKKLTVTYNSQQEFRLELSNSDLEELVVVGYGTNKKVNLSGAVDYVSGEVLESRPISNVAQGLQGMVPNLNIRFNSGGPGEAANINIRGITSINGGDPLILIDNVPVSSEELNRISPYDIESFSVIKDASAAAIYGARASFGVIIITTKSGKGGLKVTYNNNFTFNTPTVMPDKVTDPYVFSRLLELSTDNTPWDNVNYNEQFYKYAKDRSDNPNGTPGVRIDPTNPNLWEYMGNRDWTRHFLSDWNFTHNHEMAISGSSDKVSYYFSGNYNRQNSPIRLADDYFDRKTIRSKVTYKLTDYLTFGNNTNISNSVRKQPSQYSLFDIYNVFTTSYDVNPDGTWANSDAGRISARMVDGGASDIKRLDLQSTFNAELSLIKNIFKINGDYTFQRNSTNYNWFTKQYQIGFGPSDVRTEGQNSAYREARFSYYNVYNLYASYNQQFKKHYLTGIVGFNQEDYRYEAFVAEKTGLISESFPTIQLATGIASVSEAINTYALRGAFYRLNYTFNDKYILELNGRYDGSSRFPKNSRFGFFPSGSAAWLLNKENFLSSVNWLDLLKVRASYGELGNQSVGNYGYLPSMSTYESGYLIGGKRPLSIFSPALVSDAYSWEKVNTTNVGVDVAAFKNKFNASFDYYIRKTLGMLTLGRQLPGVLGASEPNENAADLRTNGWELSLGYRDKFNLAGDKVDFGIKLMLSDSYSTITRFDNPNGSILQYYKGMRMGEIWGLESDGLFTSEEEIAQLDQTSIIPWGALSIVPGWPKYVDQNNDGVISKGYTLGDTKDLKVIGNSTPRYNFGADLNANWKGFDVRAFFQGIGKRDYYPNDYLYWGVYQQPYGGFYGHLYDFYRPNADSDIDRAKHSQSYLALGLADQNLDAKYPILQSWLADVNLGTRIDQSQGLAIPQTAYLLNAAYVRLKNLAVGYSLPVSVVNKMGLQSLRFYFSAENVFEWSAVKRYFDPETLNQNLYTNPAQSPSRSGNGMTYPFQRSYSGGLQVTF